MSVNNSVNSLPFMDLTVLEKNIEESLTKIRNTISKANPLITLIQLYGYKFFIYLGDIEASVHGNVKPYDNKLLDFTQSLIVTSDVNLGTEYLEQDDIT